MSRNIATVQAMYAAFAKGDVAGIVEHLDPDVEWEHSWGGRTLKWFRPRRGRDAVPDFFADLADFEFRRFEPVAFLEGGDMVAVPIRLEMFARATGKTIRDLEVHLWTFGKDGKVTQLRHLVDTLQFADATS